MHPEQALDERLAARFDAEYADTWAATSEKYAQHGLYDAMATFIDLAPGARCVDLGCGTAQLAHALQRKSPVDYIGVEQNPAIIAIAQPGAGRIIRDDIKSLAVTRAELGQTADAVVISCMGGSWSRLTGTPDPRSIPEEERYDLLKERDNETRTDAFLNAPFILKERGVLLYVDRYPPHYAGMIKKSLTDFFTYLVGGEHTTLKLQVPVLKSTLHKERETDFVLMRFGTSYR